MTEVGLDGRLVEIRYRDVAGADRVVRAELRRPTSPLATPTPVVVWSHGGSSGRRRTDHVGDRWGQAMTDAGVAFVAIAHTPRTERMRADLCDAVGALDCATFSPLAWDRPGDIAVVLDWVESIAAGESLDPHRIVVAGHSAGAMGALRVAGMGWVGASGLAPPTDDRPIGFLVASPPGEEARSIAPTDVAGFDRPMLWLTGAGDTTRSTSAADRRATFEMISSSVDAALLWVERSEVGHGGFDLSTDPCRRAGGPANACRLAARTIAAVGAEFVARLVRDPVSFDVDRFVATYASEVPGWADLRSAGG